MDAFLGWLGGVPILALYALIFAASLVEGVLPIMPGDLAAALLAFLAARAGGTLVPTIAVVTAGSVGGALIMWWVGRRFGAEWLARQLGRFGFARTEQKVEAAEQRIEHAYREYGWMALFVSRFLPGVRAVVPAAAGAIGLPFWEVTAIFTLASLLWYGGISYIAFHVGRDWASVRATLEVVARDVGLGAIAAAAVLVLVGWRLWRRRRLAAAASAVAPVEGGPDGPGIPRSTDGSGDT
ncbi:MAG: VTT domain-containing protein [Gemmatimonadales bacterium]|nr:VTT domain-containing protein [Gemmatimonadales bacterium]